MLLAQKEITEEEYAEWNQAYNEAGCSLVNREQRMEEVASSLEMDLKLLGSTAIEDKLQDEVDTTLNMLKEAGIKVWMLTGDKIETAINIGFSCKLLDNTMTLSLINGLDKEEIG